LLLFLPILQVSPLTFLLQMQTKIQTVASGKCNHGDCRAKGCKGKSQYECSNLSCGKRYCDPDTTRNSRQYCFYSHIAEQYIVIRHTGHAWVAAYQQWKEKQDYLR
jgi:hypothetical protein